tara:strand:+ start:767 stop:1024 length:258 start_codon:yes stop_codon:yes gene_type:complete
MEKNKKELEEEIMKMPELEENQEIIKRMNNINTFQAHENEVCLRGTDEYGKDFTVWWDSYDFIGWIDSEQIEYIKEKLTKYIQEK